MKITKEMRIEATENAITRLNNQIRRDITYGFPISLEMHSHELRKAKADLRTLKSKETR